MTPLPRPIWPGKTRRDDDPKPAHQSEQDWWHQHLEQVGRDWQKLVDADIEHKARVAELEAKRAAQHREPRRIVQIADASDSDGDTAALFALCNDGTVWELVGGVWLPTPGIPQRQVGGEE